MATYLTSALVTSLLVEDNAKRSKRNRRKYCVGGTILRGTVSAELAGRHEGKVGSIRRSRKGRTTRLSNGTRYYHYGEADWYKL